MSRDPAELPDGDHFEQLVTLFLEGQSTADQAARLHELLASDAACRAAYTRQAAVHATLLWRSGVVWSPDACDINPCAIAELLDEAERVASRRALDEFAKKNQEAAEEASRRNQFAEFQRRLRDRRPDPIVIPWFVVYVTVATIAAAVAILAYQWFPRRGPQPPSPALPDSVLIARLDDSVGARWSDPGMPIADGTRLAKGKYVLEGGIVQITFDSGAKVVIESPAEINLISTGAARLVRGRLVGVVPQVALGFTIETPEATIVDLGTEFGVEVKPEGLSEVHVMAGVVEVAVDKGGPDEVGKASPTRLKAQVGKGQRILAFRLQATGIRLPNRDNVYNCFVFHSKHSKQESYVPALHMKVRRYDRSSRVDELQP